jgi:signal transduction histidine kinase
MIGCLYVAHARRGTADAEKPVKRHSLQARTLMFLGVCLAVTTICSAVLLAQLQDAQHRSVLVQRNEVALDDAAHLREEIVRMIARTKDVWLRGGKTDTVAADADLVEQSWQIVTTLRQQVASDIALTPAMRDQLHQYDASIDDFRTTYVATLATYRSELAGADPANADLRADNAMRGKGLVSSGLIGGLQDQIRTESARLRAERSRSIEIARESAIIEAVVLLFMLAAIGFWVSRVVGHGVGAVAAAAASYAAGRRDARAPVQGRGEIAQLSGAFNDMVGQITIQERQLEELRKIAVALTSATTEREVCEIVVTRLAETFGYEYVSIYLIRPGDPNNLHLITQRGYLTVIDPIPVRTTVTGRSVLERRPILVSDSRTAEDFVAAENQIVAEAVAPILTPDRVLGTLLIEEETIGKLAEADLNLITTLANNLSVALENVRLNVEARDRIASLAQANRDLAAVTAAGTRLAATLELESVYTLVAEEITRIVDAPYLFIASYNEGDAEVRMRVALDQGVRLELPSLPVQTSLSGWAVTHRTALYLDTAEAVDEFMAASGVQALSVAPVTIYSVPLIAGTRTVGAISIGNPQPHAYAEQQRAVVQTIAAQTATAINNALLYEQVQEQVSEMHRLNNELARANALKSEFLATMSHELRTPLNAIIGFSELLADQVVTEPDEVQACLLDILNSGRHLLNLINDVLDISKIEAGRMELKRTSFDLRDEIAEVVRTINPLLNARAHTLTIDDSTPLPVHADRQRVRQIILNLVSNAIKFTPDGGTIRIEGGHDPGLAMDSPFPIGTHTPEYAQIAITDTGIGIKQEDLPKLFEKFRQLDASHNRRYEGTGLGLALTKQLVELHGGKVRVSSIYGAGSTFAFTLPLADGSETSVGVRESALVSTRDTWQPVHE